MQKQKRGERVIVGIFGKARGKSIDSYVSEAKQQGARIVDVREADEFARGHIPGAVNVPLSTLESIVDALPDQSETLYVYCLSGARSSRACAALKSMGYTDVANIGGINSYRGAIER